MSEPTASERFPFDLGPYEVLAPISGGGMAEVFAARLRDDRDRVVALKVIRKVHERNAEFVSMFVDEARIASRLAHPAIGSIVGLGHEAGRHFIVMELLRGRTLLEIWDRAAERNERVPAPIAAWIAARVAEGLHHAHELAGEDGEPLGVVHRDVSPSNIFVTTDGQPKLIDFGVARARDRLARTAVGVVKGKIGYVAPEQIEGRAADRRSDVFALGITLWEVSVGARLFRAATDVDTLRKIRAAEVESPAARVEGYPQALADVVLKALARDPMQRYASARELGEALDRAGAVMGAVDAALVARYVAKLFADDEAPAWERVLDAAQRDTEHGSDAGELARTASATLAAASILTDVARPSLAPGDAPATSRERLSALAAELARHAESVAPSAAPGALAAAELDVALVVEALGDREAALTRARASIAARETAAGLAVARRCVPTSGRSPERIALIEREIVLASDPSLAADRLAEKGWAELAAGGVASARATFEEALRRRPGHASAAKGLDVALLALGAADDAHAAHLAVLAELYVDDRALSAWLLVERARALEALGLRDEATSVFDAALERSPGPGPVQRACLAHAAARRDAPRLVALLRREADGEPEGSRRASLLLDAALIARSALADEAQCVALLEGARRWAPPSSPLALRILDELVACHAKAGSVDSELAARRARVDRSFDAGRRALDLRAIARAEEARGDLEAALEATARARGERPTDRALAEEMDRILEALARPTLRVALWMEEAARTRDARERAAHLVTAARVAEQSAQPAQAIECYRAALVADPERVDAADGLLVLAPVPTDLASQARAREHVAVYAHIAHHAPDAARRVAALEAMAAVEEHVLGDPRAALATYQRVLDSAPSNRVALVGLERAARRAGDSSRRADALELEASFVEADVRRAALLLEAARTVAAVDSARAHRLVDLACTHEDVAAEALALKARLHAAAGQYADVVRVLGMRVERARDRDEKVALLKERALVEWTSLRDAEASLATLRSALDLTPDDGAIRGEIIERLLALPRPRDVVDGLVELAERAEDGGDRLRIWTQAADVAEHAVGDLELAADLLDRAAAEARDDATLRERQHRLLLGLDRAEVGERLDDVVSRLAAVEGVGGRWSFELLQLRRSAGAGAELQLALVEEVAKLGASEPAVARTMERVGRDAGALPVVANALAALAEHTTSTAAAVGALWAEASWLEHSMPGPSVLAVLGEIRERAPEDRAAIDAVLRLTGAGLDAGAEERVRRRSALAALSALATELGTRIAARLALALDLDYGPSLEAEADANRRAALTTYHAALDREHPSLLAALRTFQLAQRLGEGAVAVEACRALARLAVDPSREATLRVQTAGLALSLVARTPSEREATLEDAAAELEQALAVDAHASLAAVLLVGVRLEQGRRDALLRTLEGTLERATDRDAIATVGMELARAASGDDATRPLVVRSLERVLAAVPTHAPAYRMLARESLALSDRVAARRALESFVEHARDRAEKIEACLELAELYRLAPADREREESALRRALELDPTEGRALRELSALRRAAGAEPGELGLWLVRLAEAEREPEAKARALDALAETQLAAGDREGAEAALVEAAAQAPGVARLAAIVRLHEADPEAQRRALAALLRRSDALGHRDAHALAKLGQLEALQLDDAPAGAEHLRAALALAPTLHDARAALGEATRRLGRPGEAVALLEAMVFSDGGSLVHSLREPRAMLTSFELALEDAGETDRALAVRALRALGGHLDDAAHVALRSMRLERATPSDARGALGRPVLRGPALLGGDAPAALALVLAADDAIAAVCGERLASLGLTRADRLRAREASGLADLAGELALAFDAPKPSVACAGGLSGARALIDDDELWIVVPEALADRPEPEQRAALARALARATLGLTWIDDVSPATTLALLATLADRGGAEGAGGLAGGSDEARALARELSRKQKKALQEVVFRYSSVLAVDDESVRGLYESVAAIECRTAFALTGDLLATLDALRATDRPLAQATDEAGPRALAATLAHPVASSVVRFAVGSGATELRRRLATSWTDR